MAVVFMDGFDHYSLYEANSYGPQATDNGWDHTVNCYGAVRSILRFEDNSHGARLYGDWSELRKGGFSLTSGVIGCALYAHEAFNSGTTLLLAFYDTLTTPTSPDPAVWIEAHSGVLEIHDSTDTIVATASGVLSPSEWYYIELVAVAGASTGSAQIWVNGEKVADSADLYPGGINTLTTWQQIRYNGTGQMSVDDFYVTDSSSERLDAPRIITLYPQGQGAETGWNGTFREVETTGEWDYRSGHVDNKFISTNGPSGTKESWTYNNLPPGNWDIKAVRMPFRMQNAGAGSPTVTIASNSGATSGSLTLSNTFEHADVTHMYRDGSSLPWTKDSINNLEMSVEYD